MAISELFNSIICCSCGLCCSKEILCEQCEIATLKSNGIPETFSVEIHGLKKGSRNHSNSFEYSELWNKINEIKNRL